MKQRDLLILGALGVGAFVAFTREGQSMLRDYTGIDVDDLFGPLYDLIGDKEQDYDDDPIEEDDSTRGKYGPDSNELYRKKRYATPMSDRSLHRNYSSDQYYYPIQDLFIPPNYYSYSPRFDPYVHENPDFIDWYLKTSGLKLDDIYFPKHYTWNPDYYYYFGNLQKRWYPNTYDISHVPKRRIPYWFGEVYY